MTFWLMVLAVVVVGLALAWWTSGRSKGVGRKRFDPSAVKGDAMGKHGTAGGGGGTNINPGGGDTNISGSF